MVKKESRHIPQRDLQTLRPQYNPEQHKVYVDALDHAVMEGVQNIALSGPYGIGKSSILQGFKENHDDAIFISLSTLRIGTYDNSDSTNSDTKEKNISKESNQIQKEIVKQLLYRISPGKMPASRFKRIQKFQWFKQFFLSTIIGAIAAMIIVAFGGLSKLPRIPKIGESEWHDLGVKFLVSWLISLVAILIISYYTQGGLHFDKFTAGPATVSLVQGTESYFDRYLDEIIYFFEKSRRRLIVFEDIDRFDNPEIFDELRELNITLNNAEQLKRCGNIIFIYATKDSIFETPLSVSKCRYNSTRTDKAVLEMQRANRTKFFDLIIPVVPFITHRSARDMVRQELYGPEHEVVGDHDISNELIDRIVKYIPDFRLLRSICNEYAIYAKNILQNNPLELTADKLFAMMLYKAIHLQDFENIRLGRSNLDEIYQMSIKVIDMRINDLNKEYQNLEAKMHADYEAVKRGEEFTKMLKWITARNGWVSNNFRVEIEELFFYHDEFKTVNFWSKIFQLSMESNIYVRDGGNHLLTFNKRAIADFIGDDFVFTFLESRPKNIIKPKLDEIESKVNHYRQTSMAELMKDPLAIVPPQSENEALTFAEYVREKLGSNLAAELIRYGYIDYTFVFYTSVYHARSISANAMIFRLKHMMEDRIHATYKLSEVEVEQLISDPEIDGEDFSHPGAYNIYILQYLIKNEEKYGEILDCLIKALLKDGEIERELLNNFFSSDGFDACSLIKILTPRYSSIFAIIDGLEGCPIDRKAKYVKAAIQSISGTVDYDTSSSLKELIEDSYEKMSIFTFCENDKNSKVISNFMKDLGVKLSRLASVRNLSLIKCLIDDCCYEINLDNLRYIFQGSIISLDVMFHKHPRVFNYVLGSLNTYLGIIDVENHLAIEFADISDIENVLLRIVELDISNADFSGSDTLSTSSFLASVLDKSIGGKWEVDLDIFPSEAWQTLAKYKRIKVSVQNLLFYLENFGVDDYFKELLAEKFAISSGGEQLLHEEYIKLVDVITNLTNLPLHQRISLIGSLSYGQPVSLEDIELQDATLKEFEIIGCLISSGVVSDDIETFRLISESDWSIREFAMSSSQNFSNFITPEFVKEDILQILESKFIGNQIKQVILDDMASYCQGLENSITGEVVVRLLRDGLRFKSLTILWMASCGFDADILLLVLVAELDSLSDIEIEDIVTCLGHPYSYLLDYGRAPVYLDFVDGLCKLLDRLRDSSVGTISTYSLDEGRSKCRVNRRIKPS
ncbi:hypothetical protein [Corynebacterium durum]|uniref:YobI family P-loop NTPase n=1 Tax=Corynebacterium durum TaxID=61592 RepID=UPI0028ED3A2C|nr:hypothetical protein [Corynebacterium durum]